jgi:hypothetical protein
MSDSDPTGLAPPPDQQGLTAGPATGIAFRTAPSKPRTFQQVGAYDRNYGHLLTFQQESTLANSKPAWFTVLPKGPTIHLWINPQTYNEQTQSLFTEVPTLTGVVRLNYGEQPVQIVLEGTTGLAGWDAADHGGMDQLQRLKPEDAYPDVQVAFYYPYMFRGARYCYVDQFIQETTPDAPLFYSYQITLSCYDTVPGTSPTYVPVDPSAPSGNGWDCQYSSLNLPWTNPQHPPGFIFDRYVLDKDGNPVIDPKTKKPKVQTLTTEQENKDQSISLSPCTPRPKAVKPTPPRPRAVPRRSGPQPV